MLTRIVIHGIGLYQKYLSPFTGRSCRFYPSCSQNYVESLKKYGLVKGLRLAAVRIAKCHPFHPGGYDPVI
jgi:putative membrane protein insertion efficiency factor